MNGKVSKRKINQRKVRFRLWYPAILAVLVWAGYEYFLVQRPALVTQGATKARLTQELSASKEQYQNLSTQYKELHQDNYISLLAEKRFNLVKPGQILFVEKATNSN